MTILLELPDARESETYSGYAEGIPVEKVSEQKAAEAKKIWKFLGNVIRN
jgi:hypothetical protein